MDNIDISLSNTSINNNVNRPCINIEITGLKGVSSQELIDLTTKLTEFYNTLDSKINTTQSSLQSSINTLHTEVNQDILNESNRAINKENTLSTSLQDVAQMYTSLHSELTISINSEVTRATSKEQELNSNINSEVTRATSKEQELTASINIVSTQLATESSNREDADEELQEQITSNLNNFNNYRLKSEQDVIDSNLDSKFNSYRTSSDQNLIDEELLSKINSIEQQVNKIKNAIIDLYSSIDGGNATSNTTYVPDL